jgi:hypothetical protein
MVQAGTHTSKVADRYQNQALPFFSKNLWSSGLPLAETSGAYFIAFRCTATNRN